MNEHWLPLEWLEICWGWGGNRTEKRKDTTARLGSSREPLAPTGVMHGLRRGGGDGNQPFSSLAFPIHQSSGSKSMPL